MKSYSDLDLSRLEEHFLIQEKLMRSAVKTAANAKKNWAELESEKKVVEADVKRRIRRNPAKYRITGRVTNEAVNEAMILHPDYQAIIQQVIDAEHHYDLSRGNIKALDDRKATIEGLITLHGQGYWAKPRVSRETNQTFVDDTDAKSIKNVFSRRRKKKKRI